MASYVRRKTKNTERTQNGPLKQEMAADRRIASIRGSGKELIVLLRAYRSSTTSASPDTFDPSSVCRSVCSWLIFGWKNRCSDSWYICQAVSFEPSFDHFIDARPTTV